MKRLSFILALGSVCAWAIDIPRIGFVRDAQGRVTAINGIAGNFVLGGARDFDAALAFSWNGSYGIRKTESTVEWWDASGSAIATLDAPPGDAVIGFATVVTDPSAWIYSKSSQALFQVKVNQWRLVGVPVSLSTPAEEVLALAGNRDSVTIALRRDGALFIATFDVASGSRIAEVALTRTASGGALFLNDGSVMGVDGSTVWLQRPDGSAWSVDAGVTVTGLASMGRDWIALNGGQFGVRLRTGSDPRLFLLPRAVTE